ncbi:hypothetical protein [Priestia megaterium]|nr:hypothetical protein [Priestia megaterium]
MNISGQAENKMMTLRKQLCIYIMLETWLKNQAANMLIRSNNL